MYDINQIHEVYIGYYEKNDISTVLAVSNKKSIVKNYLENHRGLNPTQYDIQKHELTDTEILVKYEDYVISSYMGYYIPEIDQCIIELYGDDIDILIDSTIDNLKKIYVLSNNVKKIKKTDSNILLNALKILISFKSNKIVNKLKKENNKTSSILFCDIDDYLTYIRMYNDQRNLNSRYADIMMSD